MGYESKKVLVVDDSSVMRQIIKNNLKQLGFDNGNMADAEDGQMGYKKASDSAIDLIISDWNMPKMTGIEFLKAVRGDDKIKGTPFLMVTSEADKEKIMEAVQAGVNQYIVKPFNANQLEEKDQGYLYLILVHQAWERVNSPREWADAPSGGIRLISPVENMLVSCKKWLDSLGVTHSIKIIIS